MKNTGSDDHTEVFPAERLIAFSAAILANAGADEPTAHDATRAMFHASLHGIDSHGFRLLPHYRAAIQGGRLNGTPDMIFTQTRPGAGTLDADHAHGARAMYEAASRAADLARGGEACADRLVQTRRAVPSSRLDNDAGPDGFLALGDEQEFAPLFQPING